MIRLKPQQYPQFAKQFWKEQIRWEMTDCCFDNPLEQGIFWVDRLEQPQCAAVLLGDFLFLQGKAAPSFLRQAAVKNGLLLMGEQDWLCCAKESFVKTKEYLRYRFDGSGLLQNQEKLRAWCNCLPEGMRLQKIDRGWFERCREKEWMRDFVSQYQSFKEYHSTAGGWLLLAGEQPVSGASCYLASRQGFAIQVQTDEQYQGHGYAKIVSAALILEGLHRGLYPDWDADNAASAALAQALGYRLQQSYPTVMVEDNALKPSFKAEEEKNRKE